MAYSLSVPKHKRKTCLLIRKPDFLKDPICFKKSIFFEKQWKCWNKIKFDFRTSISKWVAKPMVWVAKGVEDSFRFLVITTLNDRARTKMALLSWVLTRPDYKDYAPGIMIVAPNHLCGADRYAARSTFVYKRERASVVDLQRDCVKVIKSKLNNKKSSEMAFWCKIG